MICGEIKDGHTELSSFQANKLYRKAGFAFEKSLKSGVMVDKAALCLCLVFTLSN